MNQRQQRILYLLDQVKASRITVDECTEILRLLNAEDHPEFIEFITQYFEKQQPATQPDMQETQWVNILQQILLIDKSANQEKDGAAVLPEKDIMPVISRIHFLKTAWFRYSAAALIIMFIGAYFWNTANKQKGSLTQIQPTVPVHNDVAPGGNKAILTLADGRKIILDSAANGMLAQQTGAIIIKKANGEIIYQPESAPISSIVAFNVMATPRGGQHQLTLPDGTQVWLNAASSITYPTRFSGKTRRVAITGEAYFEVAKNKEQLFIVEVNNTKIEVMGTHFNVNAYAEEASMNTTLLEGSVKISNDNDTTILKPGQQAKMGGRGKKIAVMHQADISKVMAWRNGRFSFDGASLKEVMNQLERWYDIEVVYENGIPDMHFGGAMSRNLQLSDVLVGLQGARVHFRIDQGRRLIVLP